MSSMTPPPCPAELAPEREAFDPPREPWRGPGTGARVWLVRHGSVDAGDIAYGDLDVQLSELVRAETLRAAEDLASLGPLAVWSSPLSRARALGEALAARAKVPLTLDPRFMEVHRGAWQGLPRSEYLARWHDDRSAYWRDPFHWRGHGGESEADLRKRVVAALSDALAATAPPPGSLLVVTAHRQALRALIAAMLGLPAGASHGLTLDPAHGCLCLDEPDGWTLVRSNIARMAAREAAEPEDGPARDVVARPAPRS